VTAKLWGLRGVIAVLCLGYAALAMALDINQATEAELDSLKGMGPSLSAKVVRARAQAPFQNWQDLMQRVSGIGKVKVQQFSEQGLTVNGQSLEAAR
jgi:competence protein ComEA